MCSRTNSARPVCFWPRTARRPSPARSFTLIADTRSWGCDRGGISRFGVACQSDFRDISAVHALDKREQLPLFFQLEQRVFRQELLDDPAVFLRFQAARAVNQDPARLQARRGLTE